MSYILDALKKADAQRERDPARGIHAQTAALPALQHRGAGQRPWAWVAIAAGVMAMAVAGWLLTQGPSESQRPVTVSEATPPRGVPVPAAAPAPLGSPPTPPEPAAQAVLPPPAPLPPPAVPAVESRSIAPPVDRAARATATGKAPAGGAAVTPPAAPPPATPAAVPAAAAPPPAAAAVPVAPAAPAAPGEPAIANGLPADAPKLAISGGVYSSNRSQRMLIVNGQVVNEGADLGGGVVLEEIRAKAAVLRFRGGRYNVAF